MESIFEELKENEQIDGQVQHYPKCLCFVLALEIVLHSAIDMLYKTK